jgi:Ni/Fe-hydrogenase subunit HybB-like protein
VAESRTALGPFRIGLAFVAVVGLAYAVVRFAFGIGAIANINQGYPWGWWIGFGVLSFIAFGGCGFTIALIVEIFGFHRFHCFVRPAITMGLLLYLAYAVILMIELGRPWMGWLIFFSWSPTSALFEVAWCATLYTGCLAIEFGQMSAKRYEWARTARMLGIVYLPAVVLGVSLSHLHQSSLGTLLTIVPLKIDPRWWSELLPATFLVSAYSAGLALITVEHVLATRFLRLKPRPDLLAGLARFQIVFLSVYLVLRIGDLVFRGVTDSMLQLDGLSVALWLELVAGFVVPLALFCIPEVRQTLWGCTLGASLVAGGVLMSRLNTAVVAMEVKHWQTYFPSVGEFATTFGLLAAAILAYAYLLRKLPIHDEEPLDAEPAEAPPMTHAARANA